MSIQEKTLVVAASLKKTLVEKAAKKTPGKNKAGKKKATKLTKKQLARKAMLFAIGGGAKSMELGRAAAVIAQPIFNENAQHVYEDQHFQPSLKSKAKFWLIRTNQTFWWRARKCTEMLDHPECF